MINFERSLMFKTECQECPYTNSCSSYSQISEYCKYYRNLDLEEEDIININLTDINSHNSWYEMSYYRYIQTILD